MFSCGWIYTDANCQWGMRPSDLMTGVSCCCLLCFSGSEFSVPTNFHITQDTFFSKYGVPSLMHMAFILLIDVRKQKSNKYYKSRVAQGGHMNEPAKNETRLVIH
jgi:hypothetical protein